MEMETISGVITAKNVEQGMSKKTGKPYTRCVFKINDKDYSTFDKNIYETFNVGNNIDMTGQMNSEGTYWDMLSMSKSTAPITTTPENVQPEASDRQIQLLEEILAVLKENGNSTK